jgi:TRAP-type C4-dicarboxylate transport system permease small subunit
MRDRLDSLVNRVTSGLALLGAIGVLAMLVHITGYVIMRNLAGAPIPATVEIVSYYYMVAIAFLPLAWAERRGDMISVEIFSHLLVGRLGRINAAFVSVVTCLAYLVLTYTTWTVAMRQFAARSYVISLSVAVPVWPSYFILPLAFALAALVALYRGVMPPLPGAAK